MNAARQSNSTELNRLRDESKSIDDDITRLQRSLKDLTKDNEFLVSVLLVLYSSFPVLGKISHFNDILIKDQGAIEVAAMDSNLN